MNSIFLFYILIFSVKFTLARNVPKRRRGATTSIPESYTNKNILRDLTLTTESIWEFEGVNYEEVLGPLKDEHYDCFGIHAECVMNRGQLRPICAIIPYFDFVKERVRNICEMDFRNCLRNMEDGYGIYGKKHDNDYIEWTGEGHECAYLDKYQGN